MSEEKKEPARHCNTGWLCEWCRPCSCDCDGCKRMPMTDTRPMIRNKHESEYFASPKAKPQ